MNKHDILVTVDPVIFTVIDGTLHVLLVKRNIEPHKGRWALPGGIIDQHLDADVEAAALRKLKEKTNVTAPYLEQVATVGNSVRDPRKWALTVVYFALIPAPDVTLAASWGASDVCWEPVVNGAVSEELAFDHAQLLTLALERLRNKVTYSSVAAHLLPSPFTLKDLQDMHELLTGRECQRKSITRRYVDTGIVERVAGSRQEGQMRPADLYRLKDPADTVYFSRTMEGARN